MTSTKTPREYMELSIEEMRKSIQEEREDGKVSPQVGAVLVKPNGDFVTAYRGELRDGDHAEYTLLERKCISDNLKGAVVYSTLEPCFKRNPPKVGCCKRLVKARVSKVYVGISDPDPKVNGKGIKYLEDHGVEVEMYPRDLQAIIEKENVEFMKGAEERRAAESDGATDYKTTIERAADNANLDDLSEELINQFYAKLDLSFSFGSKESTDFLLKMSLAENKDDTIVPTGLGLLLFGENPQTVYPNAVIKVTQTIGGRETDVDTITGPLIKQPEKLYEWYKDKLSSHIDRTAPKRERVYDYPLDVIRELAINAIVHRDYDIKGAPVYFEISDDAIVIKSPGQPEPPLKMEQIASFSAPSLSRNPIIMFVMDKFELVEQRGLGFTAVRTLPEKHLPIPIVSFDDPYIVITLPLTYESTSDSVIDSLSEEERRCKDFVLLNAPVSRQQVQKHLEIDAKKAERLLKRLIDKKVLIRIGTGRSTKYIAYH